MESLYQLTDEYLQLLEMAEDPDVEPEVLKDTMEAIGGEIAALQLPDPEERPFCRHRQRQYPEEVSDSAGAEGRPKEYFGSTERREETRICTSGAVGIAADPVRRQNYGKNVSLFETGRNRCPGGKSNQV